MNASTRILADIVQATHCKITIQFSTVFDPVKSYVEFDFIVSANETILTTI